MAGLPELKQSVGEAMEGVEVAEAKAESGVATPVPQQPAAKKGKKKGKK